MYSKSDRITYTNSGATFWTSDELDVLFPKLMFVPFLLRKVGVRIMLGKVVVRFMLGRVVVRFMVKFVVMSQERLFSHGYLTIWK